MTSERVYVVTIGETDATYTAPAVMTAYAATAEQIEAIRALLGEPEETLLFGAESNGPALALYDSAVHL